MSDQQVVEDEVGGMSGPQGAAREALAAEPVGREGDAGPGDDQAQQPQGPDQETWHELLLTGFQTLFDVAGSRWPSMKARPGEVETLAKSWAPVCEKHAGAVVPIEYVAVGATLLIVGPKVIGAIGEHKAAKRQAAQAAAAAKSRDPGTAYVGEQP